MTNTSWGFRALVAVAGLIAAGLVAATTAAGASPLVIAAAGCAGIAALGTVAVFRPRSPAIGRALAVCREIQAGNFEARITDIREKGDLGELLWSINDVIDRCDAFLRESAAAMDHVARNRFYRSIVETSMVGAFLTSSQRINAAADSMAMKVAESRDVARRVESIVCAVSAAAGQLTATAQTMRDAADGTSQRAVEAAAGASEAAGSTATVAAATEELSASIREIAAQVARASQLTHEAVECGERTAGRVETLAQAAGKIGHIVKFITDIADQTNLLALNATIEAARAGDVGKGFAVVAQEVKGLASQTANATRDIAGQITAIREAIAATVEGVGDIGKAVNTVNEVATAIAAAIEEQGAATQEIAASITTVSTGTNNVTHAIDEVARVADQTGVQAAGLLDSAGKLSGEADNLAGAMGHLVAVMNHAA